MKILIQISIFLIFLLSGCTGADRNALKKADAVMEEHPDSALAILSAIDSTRLSSRDYPYYALLMTQAQIKNNLNITSDSLISKAFRKYGNDWRGDKGIRSNFYKGEILFNQEKNREAMKYYLTAYEESKRLSNAYWHAKAAERIADLFFNAYNYDEATKFLIEAIRMFGAANRDLNQKYATATLAVVYINNYNLDRAASILDSLYQECLSIYPTDSALIAYVKAPMIDIMVMDTLPDSLSNYELELLNDTSSKTAIIDNTILMSQLTEICDTLDIDRQFSKAISLTETDEDKTLLYYALFEHEKKDNNFQEAVRIADSLLYYHNALTVNILKESIYAAETEFYSEKSEIEYTRSRYISLITVLISIIFALVLFIVLKYYKQKNSTSEERT